MIQAVHHSDGQIGDMELSSGNVRKLLRGQRDYFHSGQTKGVAFRLKQLRLLKAGILEHEGEILAALKKDLNKSAFEAYATEVGIVIEEINHVGKRLKNWSKPRRVRTPLSRFPSSGFIYPEPYGVSLIIAPWNYPFQLLISPLVGSIAAGNCTVLKPSEFSAATTAIIKKLIAGRFEGEYIKVVEGGAATSKALTSEAFDYIFFTGSVSVGQLVMEAASKHLTPVTLELGGKSPTIVDREANLKIAARRIVWGKFLNAGQTCVAPDYLLVHRDVRDALLAEMKNVITEFYGSNPAESPDYPRIIGPKHFDRLVSLLESGKIVTGGQYDRTRLYLAPTILTGVSPEDPVMKEEIFGPILPVLEYDDLDSVIRFINGRPKPLALYVFSENARVQKRFVRDVSYGGGCINDTIMHVASPYLPFGGVGSSGMGSYHGRSSFELFTHMKSVSRKTTKFDLPISFPPYGNRVRILKRLMK